MNTLQSCWERYLSTVVNVDATRTQVKETKTAFYAGAMSHISLMQTIADLNVEGISDNGLKGMITTIRHEVYDYMKTLEQEAINAQASH